MPHDRWKIAPDSLSTRQIPRLLADHPALESALRALTQEAYALWAPMEDKTWRVRLQWVEGDNEKAERAIGLEIPGTADPVADADRLWRLFTWCSVQLPDLVTADPSVVLLVVYDD